MQVQGQLSNSTLTLHEVQALQLKAHSLLCTNKTSKTAHDHTVSWVQAPSAAVAAEGDGEMRVRAARVTHCAAGRDGAEADPVRRGVRAGAAQQRLADAFGIGDPGHHVPWVDRQRQVIQYVKLSFLHGVSLPVAHAVHRPAGSR